VCLVWSALSPASATLQQPASSGQAPKQPPPPPPPAWPKLALARQLGPAPAPLGSAHPCDGSGVSDGGRRRDVHEDARGRRAEGSLLSEPGKSSQPSRRHRVLAQESPRGISKCVARDPLLCHASSRHHDAPCTAHLISRCPAGADSSALDGVPDAGAYGAGRSAALTAAGSRANAGAAAQEPHSGKHDPIAPAERSYGLLLGASRESDAVCLPCVHRVPQRRMELQGRARMRASRCWRRPCCT
jgi:hypothetical protein